MKQTEIEAGVWLDQPEPEPKTICMQLSVDVERWPDARLSSYFPGQNLGWVRTKLRQMKRDGYGVLPCNHHACDKQGRCSGEAK